MTSHMIVRGNCLQVFDPGQHVLITLETVWRSVVVATTRNLTRVKKSESKPSKIHPTIRGFQLAPELSSYLPAAES